MAGLTLLPGLIAYGAYGAVIVWQPPLSSLPRPKRYWRLFGHILAGLFVAFIIAYGFGQSRPQDDGGFCLDDDWKRPTAAHTLAAFMRLVILILGGMAAASNKRNKDRKWLGSPR